MSKVQLEKVRYKLQALRLQAGYTEEELAELFGPTYSAAIIKTLESGKRSLGIAILERYRDVLGIDIQIVFEDNND